MSPWQRAYFWILLVNAVIYLLFIPGFLFYSHLSFRSIEAGWVRNNLVHSRQLVQKDIQEITKIAEDYSNWTDTYDFVENQDPVFCEENFSSAGLQNLGMNFVAITNISGQVLFSKTIKFVGAETFDLQIDAQNLLKPNFH